MIYTTYRGLNGCEIGVYVLDGENGAVYTAHGEAGKPFGTFGDPYRLRPEVFKNDRNSELYGVRMETDGAETDILIYWKPIEGSRRVILRKVGKADGQFTPLQGAQFTVYTNAAGNSVAKDKAGIDLANLTSGPSGVFYIGDLNYGTYYIKETSGAGAYPAPGNGIYFILTVSEDGVGYLTGEGSLNQEVYPTSGN